MGNRERHDRVLGLESDAVEEREAEITEPVVAAGAEREGVANQRPQDAHEPQGDEAHHHRVQGVLAAHQPAIEERQGRRHQKHQGG